jgi:transglutaminase-like putative cysteine protease
MRSYTHGRGDVEAGWLALDPTHGRDQTDAYVRVAVGRDYADVPPTRGAFKGSAQETLAVCVRLQAL